MFRLFAFVYGLSAYLAFLGVFLWFIAFVGDFAVPKTVNSGMVGSVPAALATDLILILLFALPHSVMARTGFKRWLTMTVPASIERSTYMWIANATLALLIWQWQPIGAVLWQANGWGQTVLYCVFAFGWLLLLVSTFLTDHFHLFGLKQITACLLNKEVAPRLFRNVLFYKLVRHPMMLGLLISLWSVPTMSLGSLVLAAGMSAYILIGIRFEERGLEEELGASYRIYRQSTPMLLPRLKAKPADKRVAAN
ncbi:MAG: NnrU family protein [Betaproteobacteria bacterium]